MLFVSRHRPIFVPRCRMFSTDPIDAARKGMVIEQLERRGISDARVLAAMGKVRRDMFVPPINSPKPMPTGR